MGRLGMRSRGRSSPLPLFAHLRRRSRWGTASAGKARRKGVEALGFERQRPRQGALGGSMTDIGNSPPTLVLVRMILAMPSRRERTDAVSAGEEESEEAA